MSYELKENPNYFLAWQVRPSDVQSQGYLLFVHITR